MGNLISLILILYKGPGTPAENAKYLSLNIYSPELIFFMRSSKQFITLAFNGIRYSIILVTVLNLLAVDKHPIQVKAT